MPYELLDDNVQDQQEALPQTLLRTGIRTLARSGESIVGIPGDISNLLLTLGNKGIETVTGKESPLPRSLPIPTSENIREYVTKPLTGQYLEPSNSGEQFYDDVISDAAVIFLPVKGKIPFAKALTGSLGKSLIGNAAQWATQQVTGSPLAGTAAKIGAVALGNTIAGRRELTQLKNQSYIKAFENIPGKRPINVNKTKEVIDNLRKQVTKSDIKDKKFILERFESFYPNVDAIGDASLKDIINLKQDWNAYLRTENFTDKGRAILQQGVKALNSRIEKYGLKNKKFYEPYKIGEELTSGLQNANFVQKILQKSPYLEKGIKNPLVKFLLYGGLHKASSYLSPTTLALGAAGAGTAYGIRETAKAYQLLTRSPIARKYYKDVVQAALDNNIKLLAKNVAKLDNAANDYTNKNSDINTKGKWELID